MASSNTLGKTTKNSASERFVSLTDEDVERFVEAKANKKHSKKDAHRRSNDEVVFAKRKRSKTTQDIPPPELDAYLSRFLLSVRRKSGDEYEPREELSLLWSVIL